MRYIGETQSLVFRQTEGNTDPSGDYTAYTDIMMLELGDITVTLKGEAGMYCLAVWQDGAYSYAAKSSESYSDAVWMDIVETMT